VSVSFLQKYTPSPPTGRSSAVNVVTKSERPESAEDYRSFASDTGFNRGEILFTDLGNFYALFRFSA
jgi:hypothetical protein